ncbi:MAG: hypothetical protein ABW133_16305 [Polyangiaceae bacterium]
MKKQFFLPLGCCIGFAVVAPAQAAEEVPPPADEPRRVDGAEAPPPAPVPTEQRRAPTCAEPDASGPYFASTGCSGVYALRGSAVETRGVPAKAGTGLMLSVEGEEFMRRGVFSGHGSHRLAIGGGGAGFEGAVQGGLAGGFRIPFGERHGPVFRAGIFGYLRGNDAFYASLLELPQLQLGYQYLRGSTVFELGVTSGAVLTGRFRAGEAETRILGAGLEVGSYAAVHIPWFRIGVSAMRIPGNDGISSPVRTAEGTACVIASPFAICGDARVSMTDVLAPGAAMLTDVRSTYGGVAFGFTSER